MEIREEEWKSKVVEKAFDLGETVFKLNLWNHAGQVKISGWNKRILLLRATIYYKKGHEELNIEFNKDNNNIDVIPALPFPKYKKYYYPFLSEKARCKSSLGKYGKIIVCGDKDDDAFAGYIDYEIYLPNDLNTKIINIAGNVEIKRTTGRFEFDTGPCNLKCSEHSGELMIETGSGDVNIENSNGKIRVDTGSGSVSLYEVKASQLKINTGSGNVKVEKIHGSEIDIDTGSGNVTVNFNEIKSDTFKVDTGSGNIYFKIPAQKSVRIYLSTIKGKIDTSKIKSQLLSITSKYVEIKIGEGEEEICKILLDTGSGDIVFYND